MLLAYAPDYERNFTSHTEEFLFTRAQSSLGAEPSGWHQNSLHLSWQLLKTIVCIWDWRHSHRNLLGPCKLGLHNLQHVGTILTLFLSSFFFVTPLYTVNSHSYFLEESKRQKFPQWLQISTAKPLRLMKYISTFPQREGGEINLGTEVGWEREMRGRHVFCFLDRKTFCKKRVAISLSLLWNNVMCGGVNVVQRSDDVLNFRNIANKNTSVIWNGNKFLHRWFPFCFPDSSSDV